MIEILEVYIDEELSNSLKEARFIKTEEKWKKINLQKIIDFGNIKELISEMEYEEIEGPTQIEIKFNLERYPSSRFLDKVDLQQKTGQIVE